jgi:hypothetical protein
MTIRTFAAGDDIAQVGIYNEAAAALPKFKPATIDEVRRRTHAPDFDPTARFYAIVNNRPVGYASFQKNGRINYPWCRKGHEALVKPLLERVLTAMKERGHTRVFAAYRADWTPQREFFLANGFTHTHDIVNFILDVVELPTPADRKSLPVSLLQTADLPALLAMVPNLFRVTDLDTLERHFFHNPYFDDDAAFVLRNKSDGSLAAVGMLIHDPSYADPMQVDANMPCFRLGAFGTEGLTTKRLNCLFSFAMPDGREVAPIGLDLLGYAAQQLGPTDSSMMAAQVPTSVPHLLRFYERYFRKQGSFPIYERTL